MHHRGLEMREREVGIELDRACERTQAVVAPLRVAEAEVMAPVARLQLDRPPCRGRRFSEPVGADEEKGERCVRLGQVPCQIDGAADVIDGARQERRLRLVARTRHLGTCQNLALPSATCASA